MELKKILILVENLSVPFDRRVWMEATTLSQAGYQVSVICPKGKKSSSFEILENVIIYRYPLIAFESVMGHFFEYMIAISATFFLTWVVFLRHGFDVIQSANPPDLFFLIAKVFKLFGKKFVFDHHDLMPEICNSRWKGWKHKISYSLTVWAEQRTFKTADRVISTNESYRQVAIERGKMNPSDVFVVRSGPSLKKFKPVPANNSLRRGKKYLICYLGVMGPNDGLEYLLRSIDYIVHTLHQSDIHVILMGSGDLFPQLKIITTQLGLDEYVEFTGRIPDQQVKEIISSADLGVAPDPKDELNDVSTMNKIIEYMALGKPMVCYDLKEARVSAGEAALYARANDVQDFALKVVELLEQPDRRKEMGDYGLTRFQNVLAWEYQEEILLKLYRDLFKVPKETGYKQ